MNQKNFLWISSIIVLLSISTVSSNDGLAPWTPIDWTTIPPASANDKVDVIYLLSPLLAEDFGDKLEYLNLYHGAIAFVNNNTGYEITINYDAFDLFRSSVFPDVIVYENGTRDLNWIDGGATFIYEGINETYWTAGQFPITQINGSLFNLFLSEYNSQVNDTYPYYNMMGVALSYKQKPWIPSWDCFDFVWESMQFLFANGAEYNSTLKLKRDFVNVYSSIEPIDYTYMYNNDPDVKEDIIDFYAFIGASFKDLSIVEFFTTLVELFDGDFYVRSSARYWKTSLTYPYLGADFESTPL